MLNITDILILVCVYTKFVRDGNFKEVMFKQLSFSHLRLNTIAPSYPGGVLRRILDRGVPRRFVNPNPI